MNNEEKILDLLTNLTTTVNQMQGDIAQIHTQLNEHEKILSSLKTNSEFHKADIDNLSQQVANLSGEMKSEFKEVISRIDDIQMDVNNLGAKTYKNEYKILEYGKHLKEVQAK